jgi:hypothetical protein
MLVSVLLVVLLLLSMRTKHSVSHNMRVSFGFRIATCSIMLFHFKGWWYYISGQSHGFWALSVISWLALCVELRAHMHHVWVLFFGLSFSAFAFTLNTHDSYYVRITWYAGFFSLLITLCHAIYYFLMRDEANMAFYEHLAFLSYVFTYIAMVEYS